MVDQHHSFILSNKYPNYDTYPATEACYIYMNGKSVQKLAYAPWVTKHTSYC